MPFLFSSVQLTTILDITPSVKTRLAIIVMLGPRLIDPRTKVDYFLSLFRFSEEKEKVQEVLKARTQVLSSSLFRQSGLSLSPVGGYSDAAGDHTVAAKPFVGIKGMAQARARVAKAPVKAKKIVMAAAAAAAPPAPAGPVGILKGSDTNPAAEKRSNSAPSNKNVQAPVAKTTPRVMHNSSPDLLIHSNSSKPAVTPAIVVNALTCLNTDLPASDGEDSDNDSENFINRITPNKAGEKMKIKTSTPMVPLPSRASLILRQQAQSEKTINITESQSSTGSLPSTPVAGSPSKGEFASQGKVKRLIKSLVTRKFSPKYTPMAQGGNLIAADEKNGGGGKQLRFESETLPGEAQPTVSNGTSRRSDSVNRRSVSVNRRSVSVNRRNGNARSSGYGERKSIRRSSVTITSVSIPDKSPERKEPRKVTIMEAAPEGPAYDPNDNNGVDICASNDTARAWRKSTRFVNVKSLAYDFDRLKERGERRQKLRSQTPDRRQHSIRIERDKEKEENDIPAEPWYVSDKVSSNKPVRRGTGNWADVSEVMGASSQTRSSSINHANGTSGNNSPGGGNRMSKDLSSYEKMPCEGPVEVDENGVPLFRYFELVRMNVVKKYDGVNQADLENYMIDLDFVKHFGMSKVWAELNFSPL